MPYRHNPNTSAERQIALFEALHKEQLLQLTDRLLLDDPEAIAQCVAFLEVETFGCWHGRARAKMARRLKHCTLSLRQQEQLIDAILGRLASGRFSEQFKDQIRLALQLDPAQVGGTARSCLNHPKDYVRRYAAWILAHECGSLHRGRH